MNLLPYEGQLKGIADQVAQGHRPEVKVRELISWFGYARRHPAAVGWIRYALKRLNLKTIPDFDWTYLDGPITFVSGSEDKPAKQNNQPYPASQQGSFNAQAILIREQSPVTLDPTYRIGRLDLANNPPMSVLPTDTIERATTIMLRQDYSQLPVIDEKKILHGIFSWKSLGSRHAIGQACRNVSDAVDRASETTPDTPLLQVIKLIEEHDCVLLRGEGGEISSIITHYDISRTFAELSEPFLALREIENHLRGIISERFSDDEMMKALELKRTSRQTGVVHTLAFGDYLRFLDNPERWTKLDLGVDFALFREEVQKTRSIRNDVMHFDPDGISTEDLERLRGFSEFLGRIRNLRKSNRRPN